jgi:hypothetical protein
MISQISMAEVAVKFSDRPRVGASLTCGVEAALSDRALAMPTAYLRPGMAAFHYGSGATEAGQADFTWQQRTIRNYAHTTRIASAGGGAPGSHPARDPV